MKSSKSMQLAAVLEPPAVAYTDDQATLRPPMPARRAPPPRSERRNVTAVTPAAPPTVAPRVPLPPTLPPGETAIVETVAAADAVTVRPPDSRI